MADQEEVPIRPPGMGSGVTWIHTHGSSQQGAGFLVSCSIQPVHGRYRPNGQLVRIGSGCGAGRGTCSFKKQQLGIKLRDRFSRNLILESEQVGGKTIEALLSPAVRN